MVTLLLDRGADINITFGGKYGTALGAAATRGNIEMATLLLDRGANFDVTNHLGQKPRDVAILKGHYEMVSLLDSYSASRVENQTYDTQALVDGSNERGGNEGLPPGAGESETGGEERLKHPTNSLYHSFLIYLLTPIFLLLLFIYILPPATD